MTFVLAMNRQRECLASRLTMGAPEDTAGPEAHSSLIQAESWRVIDRNQGNGTCPAPSDSSPAVSWIANAPPDENDNSLTVFLRRDCNIPWTIPAAPTLPQLPSTVATSSGAERKTRRQAQLGLLTVGCLLRASRLPQQLLLTVGTHHSTGSFPESCAPVCVLFPSLLFYHFFGVFNAHA